MKTLKRLFAKTDVAKHWRVVTAAKICAMKNVAQQLNVPRWYAIYVFFYNIV
jgi:hypothetical protein